MGERTPTKCYKLDLLICAFAFDASLFVTEYGTVLKVFKAKFPTKPSADPKKLTGEATSPLDGDLKNAVDSFSKKFSVKAEVSSKLIENLSYTYSNCKIPVVLEDIIDFFDGQTEREIFIFQDNKTTVKVTIHLNKFSGAGNGNNTDSNLIKSFGDMSDDISKSKLHDFLFWAKATGGTTTFKMFLDDKNNIVREKLNSMNFISAKPIIEKFYKDKFAKFSELKQMPYFIREVTNKEFLDGKNWVVTKGAGSLSDVTFEVKKIDKQSPTKGLLIQTSYKATKGMTKAVILKETLYKIDIKLASSVFKDEHGNVKKGIFGFEGSEGGLNYASLQFIYKKDLSAKTRNRLNQAYADKSLNLQEQLPLDDDWKNTVPTLEQRLLTALKFF